MTREEDIKAVCEKVVSMNIQSTGDYLSGGVCPFCNKDCYWDAASVSEIDHHSDCIYYIAKDLLT